MDSSFLFNSSLRMSNSSNASLYFLLENSPIALSLTGFTSLFSIITNSYVICIIKVLSSKDNNSRAILNLSILEIISSIHSLSEIFLAGQPQVCSLLAQIRLVLFVIGLYSVGYVNMEIYLKIFEPFSDSSSNSRLLGILSAWVSGLVALVIIQCLRIQSMECNEESRSSIMYDGDNWQPLFIGIFVFLLGLPSFLTLTFQISVFVRILQHRRLRHRGRISLKKKRSTEISSNFSTVSTSSSTIASKECLRVIVLKASTTSSTHSGKGGFRPAATFTTSAQTTTTHKKKSRCGLRAIISDDRKMVISSGILIIVFLGGQLLPSILTIIGVVQWKNFLYRNLQRHILRYCRCIVAILHPLIYGILRENFRNLFKMLQKRCNRSLS